MLILYLTRLLLLQIDARSLAQIKEDTISLKARGQRLSLLGKFVATCLLLVYFIATPLEDVSLRLYPLPDPLPDPLLEVLLEGARGAGLTVGTLATGFIVGFFIRIFITGLKEGFLGARDGDICICRENGEVDGDSL